MCSITNEWQLDGGENCTKYRLYIDNFDKKIKTFPPGREIYSKCFNIGRSSFQVLIYPSGEDSNDRDYVSVCLRNRSRGQVKARSKFTVLNKDIEKSLSEQIFQSEGYDNTWGVQQFIPHTRCTRNDLLSNGVLALQVAVEVLEEDATDNADLTAKDAGQKLQSLEKTVHIQTGQIHRLQEYIEGMESQSKSHTNELKTMIRHLSLSFMRSSSTHPHSLPGITIECPVCLEVAGPPMRLKQCGQVSNIHKPKGPGADQWVGILSHV